MRGLITLLVCSSLLSASERDPLNALKRQQLELDKRLSSLKAKKLKNEWINPIIATYSYSRSDQFSQINKSRFFAISIDQPIFKSGGIYFAVKYSKASKRLFDILDEIKERELIKQLYSTLLSLKKIDLSIKRAKLEIDNAQIDVKRKREQYDASLIDSSFLDSAIVKLNTLKRKLLELQSSKKSLLATFKTLSDEDYRALSLPEFKLLSKEEFIEKNIEIQKAKRDVQSKRYLKNMTISNYLPTISLFGEYSRQKDSFRLFRQNDEHRRYGIKVSMPIFNINRSKEIEIKKIEYLKSKLAVKEKAMEQRALYERLVTKIASLKEEERLARESSRLYQKLVRSTRDGVRAGEKSQMDLKSMENSKKMADIDAKIIALDIAKELIEFSSKIDDEI